MHALLLGVVLVLAIPLTRPGVSYSSDEGAAILEARLLEHTGSWLIHDPLAGVDPEGHARPIPRADVGTKGRAPYAKHPVYPLVLAAADEVAGTAGIVALGFIGTVLAAFAAGVLAERLQRGLGPMTVWIVGLATPLFFDSYVVLAHTLAAAAAAFAALCALVAFDRASRHIFLAAAGVGAFVAVAAALRTEGVFIGLGLVVAAAVAAYRRRVSLRAAIVVASASIIGVAVVVLSERAFSHRVLGTALPAFEQTQEGPWLSGRWHGLLATWFTPSYRHSGLGDVAAIAAIVIIAAVALTVRRRLGSTAGVAAALAAAAVCYVLRFAAPPGAIPGLVIAFPIGWAAAWLVDRRIAAVDSAATLAVVSAVVGVAVLATQFSIGGGVEWGGRYFAVALPVAAPLVSLVLAGWAGRVPGALGRVTVVVAGVTTLVLCATAVKTLSHTHSETRRLLDAVASAGREAHAGGGGGRSVVVSTERLLPQVAWPKYDQFRWLSPHEEDLATYGHRLAAAGVDRLVLVSPDPDTQVAQLGDYREVARPTAGGRPPPVPVIVLARR